MCAPSMQWEAVVTYIESTLHTLADVRCDSTSGWTATRNDQPARIAQAAFRPSMKHERTDEVKDKLSPEWNEIACV
jgi:hypothetical protein